MKTNIRLRRLAQISTAGALGVALVACGGGGGSSPNAVLNGSPTGAVATPTPAAGPPGTLSFTILVPAATAGTASRTVKFVSPSTQSVAITLKGQTTPLATVNLTATSPGCAATSAGTSCTVSATAPVGNDMFLIAAFDGVNGTGHQLSVATVPAAITANSTTRVPLALRRAWSNFRIRRDAIIAILDPYPLPSLSTARYGTPMPAPTSSWCRPQTSRLTRSRLPRFKRSRTTIVWSWQRFRPAASGVPTA
jgi:hypothetical protein